MIAKRFLGRASMAAAVLSLAALLVSGCAGREAHRDGVDLVAAGRFEDGLAQLAAANRAEPDNLSYYNDLVRNRELAVGRLLTAANGELAAGRIEAAATLYGRVRAIEPGNDQARQGLEAVARDARHAAILVEVKALLDKGATAAARDRLQPVLLENPKQAEAMALRRRIDAQSARESAAEPALRSEFTKPVTLQFRDANLKMVFEALSRTSGINVLLDRDVKPDLKTSIFVKDVSVEDTIALILLQNQLEKKVISDNTVFVYPATPAKQKEYQDLKIKSFHLAHADPKQMQTMLKTLLKTRDVFIHEKTNSIVIRDTPDAIRLAERLVVDQDIADPEVMLEVEVLEVTRTRLRELGFKFPTGATLSTPEAVETVGQLRQMSWSHANVTPLSLALNFKLEDGDTNVLASPRIRVRNREKAKVMIGSRVPVITNAVTPTSNEPVVTGSVQYLDVGLKLEVQPDINLDNEVGIKIDLDVSSIIKEVPNEQSGTLAYQIGTRNASTMLRLKDGETQILAGLINDEDRKTASKVPGLGQIPILGRLFSSHKDDSSKTEIILSITPRIVRNGRLAQAEELEYWTGTEAALRSNQFNMKPLGGVDISASGSGAHPASSPRPAPAPAPRQAAYAGAPAQGPVMLYWQGPAQAKQGEIISLTLNAQSTHALGGFELQVGYDPSEFKAVEVQAGGFLAQDNIPPSLEKTIDQNAGQIQIDLAAAGGDGASGAGSLAVLRFEVVAANPRSRIALSRVASTDPDGETVEARLPEPYGVAVAP